MTNVSKPIVTGDILNKVIENRKHNGVIINYYEKFTQEFINITTINKYSGHVTKINNNTGEVLDSYFSEDVYIERIFQSNDSDIISKERDSYIDTLNNKIHNIKKCNQFWLIDKYEKQRIKDVKNRNLCRDKFCSNCKKVTQAVRMAKYIPELQQYDGRLHHLTLTLPNVSGEDLRGTVKHMAECFAKLIRYLSGNAKIKDIDFSSWGYEGAIRSLEVTFNNYRDKIYHPHYHVALVLNNDVLSKKNIENKYSYDFRSGSPELRNLFSKEEILIQKIWRLLIDGKRVNKENIDNLEIGYTCVMDKFKENDYAELFKYLTKEVDENKRIFTYENFKALYHGLYRVKQIQGYGVLYRIKDAINEEEFNSKYDEFIELLGQKEKPSSVSETPEDLLSDDKYILISRKSDFEHLKEILFSD
ncbi:replication protein RepB (plasmid) [Gottschalkia acidurici 9a]|uniref:Replication protein RepB n=1 Tax=Gottschalkia acidurici (strain ATCC 7906 / DSM 604 / BCRC 14475 / CIP 104303 / KCTC 5404 / NCIMB 10678 / 9a) TaxID=1128398 RepID=K0B4W7_GOTA9|nr:protein rep [Gottschalkia acidurici]AFS79925.1 replication protein RepB [Gottschalkia acidurici 9a]